MTDLGPPTERAQAPRRSRGLRLLGAALAILLLLLSAALTWLANDRDWVKRNLEQAITAVSGHPFTIEGEFDYAFGRNIEVRAAKIRWRESAEPNAPTLLEIERLSGAFELWSLLQRPVRITALQTDQARLRLAWDKTGRFNWRAGTPAAADAQRPERRKPLPLVIERAAVRDLVILLRHPALTDQLEVLVTTAQHQQDKANRLVVSGEARVADRTLALNGRIGPFPQLAVGGPVDFDLSAVGPLGSLSASGSSAALAQLAGLQVAARLQAPSANDLAQRLKLPLDTEGAVSLEAQLDARDERLQATASGSFGEFAIDARLQTENLDALDGLEASLRSSGPSARDLARLAGRAALPDAPYQLEVAATRTAQGLELQRLRLDMSGLQVEASGIARAGRELRDIDLTLTAQGEDIGMLAGLFGVSTSTKQSFRLRTAIVSHGRDRPDDVEAQLDVGDASARLTGTLSEAPDLAGSRLHFALDAPKADQLAALFGAPAPTGGPLRVTGLLDIAAAQFSVDNLKASLGASELTGQASLGRGPGSPAGDLQAQLKGPNLGTLLGPLLPPAARPALPSTAFTAAAELRLAQGLLEIRSAKAESGGNALAFDGRIDTTKPGVHLVGDLSATGDDLADSLRGLKLGKLPAQAFSLRSRLRASPGTLRFEALQFETPQARLEGVMTFGGKGYSRLEFDLTGKGSDLTAIVPGNDVYRPAAVPFALAAKGAADRARISVEQFDGELGDTRVALSGELQLQPRLAAKDFRLQASGQRLSDLGGFGAWQLTDRPFTLAASVHGDADEQRVEDLEFRSGTNDLAGRVRYLAKAKPRVELDLKSSRLNLDELRVAAPQTGTRTSLAQVEDRLFSDQPLPLELLNRFDADVRLSVDHLLTRAFYWRNVAVEAALDQGVLEIRQTQADAARGKVQLRGALTPTPAGANLSAQITATDAMFASEQMTPEELDRLPRHAIEARLSATGNTPHELAASLNGFVWIIGGEGETPRAQIGRLYGDFFVELGNAINPVAAKRTSSRIDCDGVYLEINDGKAQTAPAIVLQTEHSVVFAVGTIDLATERIDFTFETTPLKGLGISLGDLTDPFTKLTGTLRQPKITINPQGTLVQGGAAVATAGLTVVVKSLWKRWFGSHQICEKVAGKAVELRTARDPRNIPDVATMLAGTGAPSRAEPPPETEAQQAKPRSSLDRLYDMMD
ncbi:MAG: hypothetical protein RLZ44_1296 [Pseudomonadota bacterium]